ncbi:hypothetical protein EV421DRAFT_1840046 [Armillaria borealis]|uniref:Secreted protein n=1 Tax=Armillaria borealis TaxID=47425 RepID=A0AA39MI11_9AGAR|nr:hypothetical protein EV421DRAFT_1840046 [Armillaria borealis]
MNNLVGNATGGAAFCLTILSSIRLAFSRRPCGFYVGTWTEPSNTRVFSPKILRNRTPNECYFDLQHPLHP